jgi:malate dehydrogenase (oxaloacetate-decarboxylating)(NADP+)
MYIFPAIGFGSILCKAKHVTDGMIEHAAIALATSLEPDELQAELVYPRLERIRDISAKVAVAVIRKAQTDVSIFSLYISLHRALTMSCRVVSGQHVDVNYRLRPLSDEALLQYVKIKMWTPPPSSEGPSRL